MQGLMSIRMLIFMQIFADRFPSGVASLPGLSSALFKRVGRKLSVVSGVCVRVWRFVYFPVVGASLFFIMDTSRWRK